MDQGEQTPTQSTDVNAAPAVNAETQAPAAPESSTAETKELEVVYEGKPVPVNQGTEVQDASANETSNDESGEHKPEGESDETKQDGDQPREDKKRGAEQRIRQLNAEKKALEVELAAALAKTAPQYDMDKALEDGKDPLEARMDKAEHDALVEKQNQAIVSLNVDLTQQADDAVNDFPYLDFTNPNLSEEERQRGSEIMADWIKFGNVEFTQHPETKEIYITRADTPLYDYVKKQDDLFNAGKKAGEMNGQRNAEKQLSAVEIPTGVAPKTDSRADASLSPDEYAKKYNLTTVGG
ncbi:MAG TPA: hypothetical protein VJ841_03560 [Candidatus Saccharimonadales bacterium]|nr:hypothetical protein [Candidatus Saccharimonadales bacterium]